MAEGNSKKPRKRGPESSWRSNSTKKTGQRGAKRNPQTRLALILMGKGPLQTTKIVSGPKWLGTQAVGRPFNPEQAEINKREIEGLR